MVHFVPRFSAHSSGDLIVHRFVARAGYVILLLVILVIAPLMALDVTICRDPNIPQSVFAVSEIGGAVTETPLSANSGSGVTEVRVVLACQGDAIIGWNPLHKLAVPQAYAIRVRTSGALQEILVLGFDAVGTMYGGLDVAEAISMNTLKALADGDHAPRVAERGIKLNIPLDARSPSYSDGGDAAQAAWR